MSTKTDFSVADHERDRVVAQAEAVLDLEPQTIVDFPAERSAGGPNDYYSEGDYWWPNLDDPGGPYIRRDGAPNLARFEAHRLTLRRMTEATGALVAAFKATEDRRFAHAATRHFNAWFANPKTHMNPNLEFGQAIPGVCTGRDIGIVDTVHLAETALAIRYLMECDALGENGREIVGWFSDFNTWLRTSEMGIGERDHGNNHSIGWALQVAAFAYLTADEDARDECAEFYEKLLEDQVEADGSMPLELERTRPYNYSLFALDLFAGLALILKETCSNSWRVENGKGATLGDAIGFMVPYIRDKSAWPFSVDIEGWEHLPNRRPALLFGAMAYDQPEWLELWKSLDADPTDQEAKRNFPIRQPILWSMS